MDGTHDACIVKSLYGVLMSTFAGSAHIAVPSTSSSLGVSDVLHLHLVDLMSSNM